MFLFTGSREGERGNVFNETLQKMNKYPLESDDLGYLLVSYSPISVVRINKIRIKHAMRYFDLCVPASEDFFPWDLESYMDFRLRSDDIPDPDELSQPRE